jgi:hypothetical protein
MYGTLRKVYSRTHSSIFFEYRRDDLNPPTPKIWAPHNFVTMTQCIPPTQIAHNSIWGMFKPTLLYSADVPTKQRPKNYVVLCETHAILFFCLKRLKNTKVACPRFVDMWDACVLICCFFHFFLEGTVHTHVCLFLTFCVPDEMLTCVRFFF